MKIKLRKEGNTIFAICPFCGNKHLIITAFPDYNRDTLTIEGTCKLCDSYIKITTKRNNFILL